MPALRFASELAPLCSHSFSLSDSNDAVATVGREGESAAEVVHVTLLPNPG
jgi:hypothetical protein